MSRGSGVVGRKVGGFVPLGIFNFIEFDEIKICVSFSVVLFNSFASASVPLVPVPNL